MTLDDVIIVLARPAEAGNIGAVCRAMMNMGLGRLRLVPSADGIPGEATIRARAVHAGEIWDRAEIFPVLDAAIAGIPLVIGTTRRTGHRRSAHSLSAARLALQLRDHPGPAALVFGNERSGLDDAEMRLCNLAAHIPASDRFPSLNLSHAVQIFCYELYLRLAPATAAVAVPEPENADPLLHGRERGGEGVRRLVPLGQEELGQLVRSVTDSLASLGFYKQPGREEQERFFRDIFARAAVSQREGEYLAGIFSKAARLATKDRH